MIIALTDVRTSDTEQIRAKEEKPPSGKDVVVHYKLQRRQDVNISSY